MPPTRLSPSWASPPTRRVPDPGTKLAGFQLREEIEARTRFQPLAGLTRARTWTTRNQANLGATGQAVAYPRSRTFVFGIQCAQNTRSGNSTPLLNGPALVSGVCINKGGNPTSQAGWALFKHTTPFNEALVAIGSLQIYTPLFVAIPPVGGYPALNDASDESIDMQ